MGAGGRLLDAARCQRIGQGFDLLGAALGVEVDGIAEPVGIIFRGGCERKIERQPAQAFRLRDFCRLWQRCRSRRERLDNLLPAGSLDLADGALVSAALDLLQELHPADGISVHVCVPSVSMF